MKIKKILALMLAATTTIVFASCVAPKTPTTQTTPEATQEAAIDPLGDAIISEPEATNQAAQTAKKTLDKIKDSGKLILGTSADFAPYEFHDLSTGKDVIVGFDIMIAQEIAKDLGVTLEISEKDFEMLIPELTTGKIDIIMSGMNSSKERKEIVDFSQDYYFAKQCVVVRKADEPTYTTIESLKNKKVGAQTGSLQLGFAQDQIATIGAEIYDIPNVQNLGLELSTGKIEALVLDEPVAQAMIKQNNNLVVSKIAIEGDTSGFAIAIAKGNEDLTEILNKTLEKLKTEAKLDEFMNTATNMQK